MNISIFLQKENREKKENQSKETCIIPFSFTYKREPPNENSNE
jgi:hypothetical protein